MMAGAFGHVWASDMVMRVFTRQGEYLDIIADDGLTLSFAEDMLIIGQEEKDSLTYSMRDISRITYHHDIPTALPDAHTGTSPCITFGHDRLTIRNHTHGTPYTITSSNGTLQATGTLQGDTIIDLSRFHPGIYILAIEGAHTAKFIRK